MRDLLKATQLVRAELGAVQVVLILKVLDACLTSVSSLQRGDTWEGVLALRDGLPHAPWKAHRGWAGGRVRGWVDGQLGGWAGGQMLADGWMDG